MLLRAIIGFTIGLLVYTFVKHCVDHGNAEHAYGDLIKKVGMFLGIVVGLLIMIEPFLNSRGKNNA